MTQRFDTVNSTTAATPGDWSNTNNKIEVIGAGAAGVARNSTTIGGHGGGGGGYTRQTAVTLTAGNATVTVSQANAGGTSSYVKATDSVNIFANSAAVSAVAGGAFSAGFTAGFRGGNGYTPTTGQATGGHGGGAAGPNGAGGDATVSAAGFADGTTVAAPTLPAAGNSGAEFDSTHGCGTGAFGQNGAGFAGGLYGGGGSGHGAASSGTGGCAGAGGLVIRTYFADQALTQPATYNDSGEAFFTATLTGTGPPLPRAAYYSPVRPRRIAPDPGPLGTPATLQPIGTGNLTAALYNDTGEAFYSSALVGTGQPIPAPRAAYFSPRTPRRIAPDPGPLGTPSTLAPPGARNLTAAAYTDAAEAFYSPVMTGGAPQLGVPGAAYFTPRPPRRIAPDPGPLGMAAGLRVPPAKNFASYLTADDGFTILTADDGVTALTVPWVPWFNDRPGLAFIGADALFAPTLSGGATPVARPPYYSPVRPRRIAPDPGPLGIPPALRVPPAQYFASPLTADDGVTVLTADDGVTVLTVPWLPLYNDRPGLAFIGADTFYAASLVAAAITLTQPAVYTDTGEAFFAHTLTPGPIALSQVTVFVDPGEAFFAATLTPGTAALTQPTTFVDVGEAFFAHGLTTPLNLVQPAIFVDPGEAFFTAAVTPGSVGLSQSAPYSDTGEAFFSAALTSLRALTAALFIDPPEAFFAAALSGQNALTQPTTFVDVGEVAFTPSSTSSVFAATAPVVEFLATDGIAFSAFLESAASQTLTTPGWTEFRDVVPAITVPGPIEAQATQIGASAGPAEFLATFAADRPGFVENQIIQLSGGSTWTEFLAPLPVSIFGPIEFQASQAQVSQAPSEFLNSVITGVVPLLENQASQILNGSAQAEFQTVLSALAVTVPAEFQTTQSVVLAPPLEFSAIQQANPVAPGEWLSVSITGIGAAQLEVTALQGATAAALLEFLNTPITPGQHTDLSAQLEFQALLAASMPATAEWLANWRVDVAAPLEALPVVPRLVSLPTEFVVALVLPNVPSPLEFSAQIQVIGSPLVEAAALLSQDQRAAAEWLAAVLRPDTPMPVEFGSPMLFTDVTVPLEFGGSLFVVTEQMPLEWVSTLAAIDRPIALEWGVNILSGNVPANLEWLINAALIQSNIPVEALASALNISPAVFEWLGTHVYIGGGMAPVPLEFGTVLPAAIGLLNYERLAGVASDPDLGLPIEWLALRPPSIPNLRPGQLRSGGTFNRPAPFAAIDIGETDNFAFDFSNEVGAATITSTGWTCRVAPFQTISDLNPQSHVISAGAYRVVSIRSIVDGALIIKSGAFSVASIGGFAHSSMGGTYILEATANLSNGRSLQLAATVRCKSRYDG